MDLARDARIYVAGHRGLVGSALWRALEQQGFRHLIGKTRAELDLLDQGAVNEFFRTSRPEYVFLAAAKVGGIQANNTLPADFLYQNLQIQTNIIHAAKVAGARKLLFLGSSCIYPREAPQPLREDYLLSGKPEPTNEWYAVAKLAGLKLCQAYRRQFGCDFISVLPANLYGPNDNYDLETSHVLPALIRRFHEAKTSRAQAVTCWGTGTPRREFLYVDDLADACVFLLREYSQEQPVNIGSGADLSIQELAQTVRRVVGYQGQIVWDPRQPDGMPRKLLDSSRLFALGWRPRTDLQTGLALTYAEFLARSAEIYGPNGSV